jgi:multidrug efflux pump subunit AcrA (membrane-fusion protein)
MKSYALFLSLLAGFTLQAGCSKHPESAVTAKALPAQTLMLQRETVPMIVEVPGTAQSKNRITLSSQINGYVREMRVRVGDTVPANKILALLDARDPESQQASAQAGIDEAQAALSETRRARQAAIEMRTAAKASADLAEQTLARYEKLFASRSVSPQEIDEIRMRRNASAAELASRESMVSAAEDRIKQVEAKVAQAKAQGQRSGVLVSWTQIKAPSNGKIVERLTDPGTAIFPGTPLLIMESTGTPQILATIPTEHAASLHQGMQVRIRTGSEKNLIEGRVTEIAPLSDPATHSVQFKVDLPSSPEISNGQFVTVLIPAGMRSALLAPAAAVRETGQLTGLYAIDGTSTARFRLAKITPYDSARVEILSGLEAGEKIVALLDSRIIDGITVEARQ